MKRKILSMFLCSVMLASGVCGCGKDESTVDNSLSSSTDGETNISSSVDTGIPDWLNHMTFHEVPVSFPCKFNDFSEDFTLGNGFYFDEADYTFYDLLYQGNKVASVGIDGEKSEQNNDKEVIVLIVEDEQLANLEIDGASCDVDIDTMIDRLGEPYNKSVGDWISNVDYVTDNLEVSITFNDNQADEIKFLKKSK